jgi:hypothetical protein
VTEIPLRFCESQLGLVRIMQYQVKALAERRARSRLR